MRFLDLINQVCFRYGLNPIGTIQSPTNLQQRRLKALMNTELKELIDINNWSFLKRKYYIQLEQPVEVIASWNGGSNNISITGDFSYILPYSYIVSGEGISKDSRVTQVSVSGGVTHITLDQPTNADSKVNEEITLQRDTYPLPDDFVRFIDRTLYIGNRAWPLADEISTQTAAWYENYMSPMSTIPGYMQIGPFPNSLRIYLPGELNPVSFYYITNNAVQKDDGTFSNILNNDNDTSLFNSELLIKGTIWRYREKVGLDYQDEKAEYEREVRREVVDKGRRKILTASRRFCNRGNTYLGTVPFSR